MKRDLDLCRQLLLDLEQQGSDCALNVLRHGTLHDASERVRFHLHLLIDAGLVKEVDRTTNGVPCVRLTHSGYELLDLSRNEVHWREAKAWVQERTGGQSLTVLRDLLLRSAHEATDPNWHRPAYRPYERRPAARYLYERYRNGREIARGDEVARPVHYRADFRERVERPHEASRFCDYESVEESRAASLPIYLV